MAHGLEARVPFLDLDFISLALSLPVEWKLHGPEQTEKWANPDGIHLDAVSQRKFGYRYFEAFSKECHVLEPIPWEEQSLKVERDCSKTEQIYLHSMALALGKITYEEFERQMMEKVMQP